MDGWVPRARDKEAVVGQSMSHYCMPQHVYSIVYILSFEFKLFTIFSKKSKHFFLILYSNYIMDIYEPNEFIKTNSIEGLCI